jgi:hypothetical protein
VRSLEVIVVYLAAYSSLIIVIGLALYMIRMEIGEKRHSRRTRETRRP